MHVDLKQFGPNRLIRVNVYWTQTEKRKVKNVCNIIEYQPGIEMFSLENAVQFVYILQ